MSEARRSAYRLSVTNSWRNGLSSTGHCSINRVVACGPVLDMTSDVMRKELIFTKPYDVILNSREEWSSGKVLNSVKGCLVWYTDGSLIGGRAGMGAFSPSPRTTLCASLGDFCTVFQAEVLAILGCVDVCLSRNYQDRTIVIFSDSQAAIKALDSREINSKLVWECHRTLSMLASRNNVRLSWVPGHQGFGGNETADQLAKRGAVEHFIGPEPFCGVSRSTAFHSIHNWTKDTHLQRWRNFPGQVLCKKLVGGLSPALSRRLAGMSRARLRQVVALFTGHGHFRKHLLTLGINRGSPECRLCNSSLETARHIILDCEALEARRRTLFGALQPGDAFDVSIGDKLLDLIKGTGIGFPV